jgi:hypothetical protein
MPGVMLRVEVGLRQHETGLPRYAETEPFREAYALIKMWRKGPPHSPRHLILPSDWCNYYRQNFVPQREAIFKSESPPGRETV